VNAKFENLLGVTMLWSDAVVWDPLRLFGAPTLREFGELCLL
jgi:hypothetical protein